MRRRKRQTPSFLLRGFWLCEIIFIRGQIQCDALTNLQHDFWHLEAVWKHAVVNALLPHRGNIFGLPGVELWSHFESCWEDCSHVLLNAPPSPSHPWCSDSTKVDLMTLMFHPSGVGVQSCLSPPPASSYSGPGLKFWATGKVGSCPRVPPK